MTMKVLDTRKSFEVVGTLHTTAIDSLAYSAGVRQGRRRDLLFWASIASPEMTTSLSLG